MCLVRKARPPDSQKACPILGPFETETLRTMIREGKLEGDDEICGANSYWIRIQESSELEALLGMEYRAPASPDEEPSQPDVLLIGAADSGMRSEFGEISSSSASTMYKSTPRLVSQSVSTAPMSTMGIEKSKFWS